MQQNQSITLAGRKVGLEEPAFVIAEVAQAHDGSLGLAHAFIDTAADIGADAIKFQTHIASAESTLDEQFRVKFSRQDETRFDYWKRMEFTAEQWQGLSAHAAKRGLVFLSSAFSEESIRLLRSLKMPAWKIASGEVTSRSFIDLMAEDGNPFLLSSGMSDWAEIEGAVRYISAKGNRLALMQCTSRYPTRLEDVGLNVMDEMRRRFACPVGLSDHSGVVFPALAALASGASILELHLTLDRRMFGPDVSSSLLPDELRQVVAARDAFHIMHNNPVDKDLLADELRDMRALFNRSLAARGPLPAGTILDSNHLTAKKPGTGIPANSINDVIGLRLLRDVSPNHLLTWDDLESRESHAT